MKALEINQLAKTYHNGVTALKGISFDVEAGDFFALLGPNGAGKTTTIGIITSLVNKSGGSVKVFGHDIDSELSAAKAEIGLVPQEFNFGVFEKIIHIVVNQAGYYGIPRKLAYQRAEIYLKKLGLWEKRDQAARNLSGGMKRRLMIARALVHKPRLLILDEPTAGVDIELRRSMWDFLKEINERGTTVILTTHYLEEAENLCRNIAIIDHGEIVENTRMRTLLDKLTMETFVLYLEEAMMEPPQLDGFTCRLADEYTLEVDIIKGQRVNDLFQQLSKLDIKATSMRNKANRLEELFIKMVYGKNNEEQQVSS